MKAESEDLSKSRFIKVHSYLEERAAQIADLLQAVDNSNLVSGEVTKGPRTAAQRLPRHMRRRAMAYDVRRFPKGLRKYAAPFLALSKHRKKPPSRFYRRKPRNLLLNYIRRQRKSVWLETHIWHAKRFHIVDKWGYRLPDRSFQRSFRPCYRDSLRHCVVRDKSYLFCFLISHNKQDELISMLSSLCVNSTSPTFAFKSALSGRYECSTLLYHPGQYPRGLIGPARFLWSRDSGVFNLAIWIHPSCRDEFLAVLKMLLSLEEQEPSESAEKLTSLVPRTVEEWRLSRMKIYTDSWIGKGGVRVQNLGDQLVRIRLYGPISFSILSDSLKLVDDEEATDFRINHSEWRDLKSKLAPGCATDGSVFSLLVEDSRISRPTAKKIPVNDMSFSTTNSFCIPQAHFWRKDVRLKALSDRLRRIQNIEECSVHQCSRDPEYRISDQLFGCKAESLGTEFLSQHVNVNICHVSLIPVLIVIRNGVSGRGDTLSGCELIAPCGFGMDFWIALQLRTARASGWRDELIAHMEASRFCFPTDAIDATAGMEEINRMQAHQEVEYEKRPHNRRPHYWRNLSVKYPFSFEYAELVNDWLIHKGKKTVERSYVLRDRRALVSISKWMQGRDKAAAELLTLHYDAVVPVELQCIARGKPRRYGLVCLPTKEDLEKIRNRHRNGPVRIVQESRSSEEESSLTTTQVEVGSYNHGFFVRGGLEYADMRRDIPMKDDTWKDIVSLDPSTREKPISLKMLFPEDKVVDKTLKRKIANRKKREKAKRRRVDREARLKEWNAEKEEKDKISYRESANRLIIGRIIRGDFSFYTACGRALSYIPVVTLEDVRNSGGIVLLRNSTSKYYHPAKLSILSNLLEI